MYPSAQLVSWAHRSPTSERTDRLWAMGCELHTDAQKDHSSLGSQHEKHLPKETLLTSCQGVKRNDTMTDRLTNKEWQVWSDKCGVPHNRDWSVGNAQKTPNPQRRRKDKQPPPKPSPPRCPISFPHIHQLQSHIPGWQASNSGVTVYTLIQFELPRVYLFYSWGSHSAVLGDKRIPLIMRLYPFSSRKIQRIVHLPADVTLNLPDRFLWNLSLKLQWKWFMSFTSMWW